jgi:hypothetical protein
VGSLLIIGCSVEAANILVLGGANRLRIKPAATSEAAVTAAVGSAVSRDALLLCMRSFSLLARAPTTRVGRELWSTGEFRASSRSPTRMRSAASRATASLETIVKPLHLIESVEGYG